MEIVTVIVSILSALIAAIALMQTYFSQKRMEKRQEKQATIDAFNLLQEEVFDKLLSVDKENAKIIIEALEDNYDNNEVKRAYSSYKMLLIIIQKYKKEKLLWQSLSVKCAAAQ